MCFLITFAAEKNDWVSGVLQSSGLVKSLYPAEISQARAFLGKLAWRSYFFTLPADGETGCAVNFTTNKGEVIRVSLHKYGAKYSLHLRSKKTLFITTLSDEESRLVMSFAGYYENSVFGPIIIEH
ncbi:hypothetical protein CKA38_08340 [Ereboglobus luteus]|uniref:Uncharacterized protein n=1 Tax=Ereboglobus luteus TaxID=1796921 RepID=A0A2U8E2Z7_9BACT|nr:hypothetical protein CKA38_08340 [Ereboglobus luteus]